jgi:hypothetical protein
MTEQSLQTSASAGNVDLVPEATKRNVAVLHALTIFYLVTSPFVGVARLFREWINYRWGSDPDTDFLATVFTVIGISMSFSILTMAKLWYFIPATIGLMIVMPPVFKLVSLLPNVCRWFGMEFLSLTKEATTEFREAYRKKMKELE